MKNKTAIIISAALTAFVLFVLGGLVTTVRGAQQRQAALAKDASAASSAGTQSLDPNLEQAIRDREAAYQKLIDEANARLIQAQKDEQTLKAQLDALQKGSQPTASQAAAPVTPQDAAQIATRLTGQNQVFSVETVPLNGSQVYQVTMSSGDLVFISMSGQLLGVQPAQNIASANGSSSVDSQGYREREHEDEEYGGGYDD